LEAGVGGEQLPCCVERAGGGGADVFFFFFFFLPASPLAIAEEREIY